jgi:uncharacterized protein YecT (DUF1311 family)
MRVGHSVFALMLVPAAATAQTPAQDGYMYFALTGAEIAEMPNADDKACLAKADQEPYAVIACTAPQFDRIEKRLSVSYHSVLARLPKAKSAQLKEEQGIWLITRDLMCRARVGDELNEMSITYHAAMIQCVLDDLYRRTLWVERYQ